MWRCLCCWDSQAPAQRSLHRTRQGGPSTRGGTGPSQAMTRGAVHAPFAQGIASQCCSQFQPQHALWHVVVHVRDFGMRLVRVRHQVQLDDACPLNVCSGSSWRATSSPSFGVGLLIRVRTKSRKVCDLRSNARTCHRRPVSSSAKARFHAKTRRCSPSGSRC